MKLRLIAGVAAVAALAGCGIGRPWPGAPAASIEHRTVLVIGDSLAGQADVTLPGVLAAAGLDATVIDAHVNGSGLIGPVGDQPSALAWVQAKVEAFPEADTVFVQWVGACSLCGQPGFPVFGSSAFFEAWSTAAHEVIDYLHAQGKLVVWAASPPLGAAGVVASGSQAAPDVAFVLTMRDASDLAPYAAAGGPVGRVDWFVALTDTAGRYQTVLLYDGVYHAVRTPDLVHFTMDGSTRASTWTAKGLGDLWAASPLPVPGEITTQRVLPALVEAGDPVTLDVGGAL